ncbi:MAG: hypothetical protein O3A46_13040 [Candidatus Poribacteria bacterium]|nr:hypothetical protein [Candidatus Poribacteria bacterium]
MRGRGYLLGALSAFVLSSGIADAEVEKVEMYLYGGITNASKNQIRRQLAPYVEPDSISFRQMVRENGKEHPWVTIVEVQPNGWRVDFYDLMHRIKDVRGVNDGRVLYQTEVTATGDLRAHFGFTRRSFGVVPGWVQARGVVTSGLWHHLRSSGSEEAMVFHQNEAYDQLRLAPHNGKEVRVRGRIGGFDGAYPVVVLGDFEILDDSVDPQTDIPQRTRPDLPERRDKRENRPYDQ